MYFHLVLHAKLMLYALDVHDAQWMFCVVLSLCVCIYVCYESLSVNSVHRSSSVISNAVEPVWWRERKIFIKRLSCMQLLALSFKFVDFPHLTRIHGSQLWPQLQQLLSHQRSIDSIWMLYLVELLPFH